MIKKELLDRVNFETGTDIKTCAKVVNGFMAEISKALERPGAKIELRGFGVFRVVMSKARKVRKSLHSAEMVIIPERARVKFKISKSVLEKIRDI